MLEREQRRATKIIQKLRNISYEMCLKDDEISDEIVSYCSHLSPQESQ